MTAMGRKRTLAAYDRNGWKTDVATRPRHGASLVIDCIQGGCMNELASQAEPVNAAPKSSLTRRLACKLDKPECKR